jgi:cell filamentation protein
VLRSKFGITDQMVLSVTERANTLRQTQRITTGRAPIDRTFGASHLQAIHAALFSALYDWAGQFHTVDIRRGVNEFADVDDIPGIAGSDASTGQRNRLEHP